MLVVELRGELSARTGGRFYQAVQDERPGQFDGLVIDLSEVGYLDSGGLGACVRLLLEMRRAEKRGALVVRAGGSMDAVIALANVRRVAPVFKSCAEAFRCLSSPPAVTQKPEQVTVE